MRIVWKWNARSFDSSFDRLLGCSVARLLGCSVARLLGCSFARPVGFVDILSVRLVVGLIDRRSIGSSVPRLIGWSFVRHLCLHCKSKGAAFEMILEFKRKVKFKAQCLFRRILQPHESWGYRGRGWNRRVREWRRNRQGETGKNNDNASETNSHLTRERDTSMIISKAVCCKGNNGEWQRSPE